VSRFEACNLCLPEGGGTPRLPKDGGLSSMACIPRSASHLYLAFAPILVNVARLLEIPVLLLTLHCGFLLIGAQFMGSFFGFRFHAKNLRPATANCSPALADSFAYLGGWSPPHDLGKRCRHWEADMPVTKLFRNPPKLAVDSSEIVIYDVIRCGSIQRVLVNGQALDLEFREAQDRGAGPRRIALQKTAPLIALALALPALLAGADASSLRRLRRLSICWGLLYQGIDDAADVVFNSRESGKSSGRDAALGRPNVFRSLGQAGAFQYLDRLIHVAHGFVIRPLLARTETGQGC